MQLEHVYLSYVQTTGNFIIVTVKLLTEIILIQNVILDENK